MHLVRSLVGLVVLVFGVGACSPGATGSSAPSSGNTASAPAASVAPAAELPSLTLQATIDGFEGAVMVAATSDAVWVLDHPKSTVVRIDPKTNNVTDRITLGTGFSNGLGLAGGRLWTFHQSAGEVVGIDPKTAKVVATVQQGQDGDQFWVGDDAAWLITGGGTVVRIDGKTSKVISFPVDDTCGIAGAAAGGGFLWLASSGGVLCKVDEATGAVVAHGTVAGNGNGMGIVLGSPWLAGADNGLVVVDATTLGGTSVAPPLPGTFQGAKYGLGLAGGDSTVIVGDADGSTGWLRYTGGAIGRVLLGDHPAIVLYAGFPPGQLAGGVVVAFDSLWVANFDAGTTTRYALPPR